MRDMGTDGDSTLLINDRVDLTNRCSIALRLIGNRDNTYRCSLLVSTEISLHYAKLYSHVTRSDDSTDRLSCLRQLMSLYGNVGHYTVEGGSKYTTSKFMLGSSKLSTC